jgi:hypothetical protein
MNAPEYLATLPRSQVFSELAAELWSGLGPRIPWFLSQMQLEGKLAVGVISKSEPQIMVRYLPNRDYAIVIHEDLPHLIYRVARAASAQISFTAERTTNTAQVNGARFVQLLTDILWWFKQTGTVFGPEYTINEHQRVFAGNLAVEAERFLIAHELGHIIVNPGGEPNSEDLIERLVSGAFSGFVQEQEGADIWEEEHRADLIAFDIVMGVVIKQESIHGWENQLRYAGVELMLLIEYAMEQLGFTISLTHPPASARLEMIRRYARFKSSDDEEYERLAKVAHLFQSFIVDALARYFNPDQAMYQIEGDRQLEEIHDALQRYSVSTTPEYLFFYETMDGILSRGYYEATLKRLEDYVKSLAPKDPNEIIALEFRETVGEVLDKVQRTQLRYFRMYKLIVGYFARQANPLGWYMMNRIEGQR